MGRKTPYTQIGIRRLKCFRCGAPAVHQWNICADNNVFRPICLSCDIEVNEIVLKFMGFGDWEEKMRIYKEKASSTK